MFLGAVFLWGIMQATNHLKGNFPQEQFPEGYCQGAIIFGIIFREQQFRGQLSGGNYPAAILLVGNFAREQLSMEQLSLVAIARGAIIWGGGQSSRGQLSGGQFFLGLIVRTPKNFHLTLVASRQNQVRSHLGWLVHFSNEQIIILQEFLKEGEISLSLASAPNWASSPPYEQLLSLLRTYSLRNISIWCCDFNGFISISYLSTPLFRRKQTK